MCVCMFVQRNGLIRLCGSLLSTLDALAAACVSTTTLIVIITIVVLLATVCLGVTHRLVEGSQRDSLAVHVGICLIVWCR